MAEQSEPLMEDNVLGVRNTTRQFLRSFSQISDDSDFSDLDEPETPGDLLGYGGGSGLGLEAGSRGGSVVRHTTTRGLSVESAKGLDHLDSKTGIPFVSIHKPRKGFTNIRADCWMNEPIRVSIANVQREEHPHMTRKAFNPNLYTIVVTHGDYKWTIKRRYKHFDRLHKSLRLFRARYSLPVPTKQHRERRQSIKEDRKERKIKKKQQPKISRFPKKPEWMVRESALEQRKEHLEKYLQSVLESKWYRNHTELLKFLEVSELSFVNRLGQKWREGDVNKCSGGRRISIGCCGCLKKYHVAGRWSKRWLIVKDTFIAYTRPSDGLVCDVMLMDGDFHVESGMSATGAPHGLLITNLSRCLLAKVWTSRKADEWEENIRQAIDSTGKEFTRPIRYNSFAPVRDRSYARWFVDGSSYFEAVADALEKAKEEIFITDWWLSPEIYLKRNVTDRERWRLDEILGRKAKAGVKVFVLLYKELEIALTINSHYSKHALMDKCPENIKVIRHPDHVAGGNRVLLWAHHEKIVVIDQKTAFLGGLDMCYGRWDDDKHRMTDLGSVTYDTIPDPTKPVPEATPVPYDIPNTPVHVNGITHKHKERHRRTKCQSNNPHSPIMELDEDPMSEISTGATGDVEQQQHRQQNGGDNVVVNGHTVHRKDPPNRSESVQSATGVHLSVEEMENMNRHSMRSEDEFGSNDHLTDHDSLEELNGGYKNVVAEVMIHSPEKQTPQVSVSTANESSHLKIQSERKGTANSANGVRSDDVNQDSDSPTKQGAGDTHRDTSGSSFNDATSDHNNGNADSQQTRTNVSSSSSINDNNRSESGLTVECSKTCNNPTEEDKDNVPHGNTGKKSLVRAKRLSDDTVEGAADTELDLDALEKQIITDTNKLNDSSSGSENMETSYLIKENGTQCHPQQQEDSDTIRANTNSETNAENITGANKTDTDMNRNQTKKLVSFKDHHGGTIQEEAIIPAHNMGGLEASPRGKKDASAKRETWASKKIRKTLGLSPKGEKYEEEDQADGKDKSDSDDNTSGGATRFRNKWRMVLNVKKLEHAGKTSEDEETIPPESPYSKTPTGHASMSLTRLKQSMPFMNRRDSDEDLYYNLYPWKKRFWRRDEGGSGVMVKSIMRMGNDDAAQELEGLAGQSKLWIGKDYVNFIHKDPVDVQNPFEDFIDRSITPRMPWHDIGGVVYGKAARDVARHFIRRWNFCKTEKFKKNKNFPLLLPKSYQKCEVSQGIKDITYEVKTQILRSACGWSAGINSTESSIHQAYIDAIKNAKHYIYIENQFFITQVGDHALVKNEIGEALVSRIQRAYKNKEQFRVYVVMPLLPAFEGEIGESGGYPIQAVLHWNYKSISKGPNSVIANLQKTVDDPKKYILFCGLRSHAELKNKLTTELIYVHSKLMIVDDDTVIIGSANINDRSMMGSRDSELAYLTEDIQKFPVKMGGVDHMAGRYASSLRRTLFREHLGIEETNFDVDLTDPVSDEFYKNIWLHQASINTTMYYKVFKCIPDDHIKTFAQLKEVVAETNLAEKDKAAALKELQKVKGYLVLLPLYFLEFEDSLIALGAKKESLLPAKMWF